MGLGFGIRRWDTFRVWNIHVRGMGLHLISCCKAIDASVLIHFFYWGEHPRLNAVYQGSYQQNMLINEDRISSDGEILHGCECTLWMYVGHIFSWRKRHFSQLPAWKFNWIRLDLGFEATSIWVRTTTYIWLVGGLEHFSFFHSVGDFILPTDFHIFQRGGEKPPTRWQWYVPSDVLLLNAYQLEVSIISVKNVRLRGRKVVGTVSIVNQNHVHIFIYFH